MLFISALCSLILEYADQFVIAEATACFQFLNEHKGFNNNMILMTFSQFSQFSQFSPVFFGREFKPFANQGYFSGGAGYGLFKALKRFVETSHWLVDDHDGCS